MNDIKGLSWKDATRALRQYGLNEITEKQESLFKLYLFQLKSPKTLLLFVAAIISFFSKDFITALVILAIIVINSLLKFYQEYTSKNTFKNLERLIRNNVYAIRDGKKVLIDKSTVVPGDILVLGIGDAVSADCFVIQENNLSVDESALTGQAEDIYKVVNKKLERNFTNGNLYTGSYIASGDCLAKVFATGNESKFAETVFIKESNNEVSKYEQSLNKVSTVLFKISIAVIITILIANIILKQDTSLISILLFTIAISIAIIPELLPIFANLSFSKSALRLSNKKVVVRNNSAIEDLGNIDIICTDKSGMLTINKLKVDFFNTVIDKDEFYKYSYLSTVENNTQLDKCIFKYLKDSGVEDHSEFMLEEIPFNIEKKFSARKFKDFEIIKGSPEYILKIAQNNTTSEKELIELNYEKGLKVISFAIKEGMFYKYIGSYFFFDQIKEGVEDVILNAKRMGVAIKIITEDSKATSGFVAQKVGLLSHFEEVILGEDLDFSNPSKLLEQVTKHSVFARCNQEQRYKIIECLQTKHFVAYLGDGLNDSTSLTLSNVGIVVDSATDIAKQDSDIILLSSGLDEVIDGILESRKTFENIEKYLRNSLVFNYGRFFMIGLLSIVLRYMPMLTIQILILNLLINIPLLSILNDKLDVENVKKPKDILLKNTLIFASIFTLIFCIFDLIFFYIVRNQQPDLIQTQWFTLSMLVQVVILSLRTRNSIFDSKYTKPDRLLIKLSAISICVTLILALLGIPGGFKGISIAALLLSLVIIGINFIFIEAVKVPLIRMLKL